MSTAVLPAAPASLVAVCWKLTAHAALGLSASLGRNVMYVLAQVAFQVAFVAGRFHEMGRNLVIAPREKLEFRPQVVNRSSLFTSLTSPYY